MHFGTSSTGVDVKKITLSSGDLTVSILTWGAILQDVRLAGVDYPLTLGSDDLADYEGDLRHHGSIIGPIVGRISTARVKIDGMMYELERNENGTVHLHSGAEATHHRPWTLADQSDTHATLTCDLADGACGLPGRRTITVTYRVSAPATLTVEITGTSDATTAMNFANHSYWNLDGTETWEGHTLRIAADRYLPNTVGSYPTGEIAPVAGTNMDLRQATTLSTSTHSFNHNFCLSDQSVPLRDVLHLTGTSGVSMVMATTEPGLQVFDNSAGVRPGRVPFEGLAFEAQKWPDAPNNPGFPSILMTPDQVYSQMTSWTFSA